MAANAVAVTTKATKRANVRDGRREVVDEVGGHDDEDAADGRQHVLHGDLGGEHRRGGDGGGAKAPQHPALAIRGEVRRHHDQADRGGREGDVGRARSS